MTVFDCVRIGCDAVGRNNVFLVSRFQGWFSREENLLRPAQRDFTASGPVRSPDCGRRTGRRGFHRLRAGQIPKLRPPQKLRHTRKRRENPCPVPAPLESGCPIDQAGQMRR
jgi:hypothetical protein